MAEFPALPLWTDAYLGDTTHLTTFQHGAYLLLLMVQWRSRDCALPDDDVLLARYARCTQGQWKKLRPVLAQFFSVRDGQWRQLRLVDEHIRVSSRRERAAANGRASALKRQGRHSTKRDPSVSKATNGASTKGQLNQNHIHSTFSKEENDADASDADQIFWANAKAFLKPEARGDPGALIGKWSRDYGKEATAQAITRAQLERPVQRIPFIVGCLRDGEKRGGELSVPC